MAGVVAVLACSNPLCAAASTGYGTWIKISFAILRRIIFLYLLCSNFLNYIGYILICVIIWKILFIFSCDVFLIRLLYASAEGMQSNAWWSVGLLTCFFFHIPYVSQRFFWQANFLMPILEWYCWRLWCTINH